MNKSRHTSAKVPSPRQAHCGIIACDLDGTLIGRDHKINETDLAAIAKAQSAGWYVTICTGRSAIESAGILAALQLAGPGIFVNGAALSDMAAGATLHREYIAPKLAGDIVAFFQQRGHTPLALLDDAAHHGPYYAMLDGGPVHPATTEWFGRNRIHAELRDSFSADDLSHMLRIGMVIDLPDSRPMEAALHQSLGHAVTFHALRAPLYDCNVIEVFKHGVTKWTGIELLCQKLNVSPKHTVAIGDDINDLAMLQHAGQSFAMGNASGQVRRAAKAVTRTQAEAGVAAAIEQVLGG